MALPDFVQEVLDYLDTNWNTSNFDPQPTLVDGDEMRLYSGGRARSLDVVNENIVTVDSQPTGENTPVGTEFDYRVRRGVTVQIEGYHQDSGGQITDKDGFDSLVTETRRAILVERTFPGVTTDYQLTDLSVEDENDLSPDGKADYFRYTFDVWFEGYEELP